MFEGCSYITLRDCVTFYMESASAADIDWHRRASFVFHQSDPALQILPGGTALLPETGMTRRKQILLNVLYVALIVSQTVYIIHQLDKIRDHVAVCRRYPYCADPAGTQAPLLLAGQSFNRSM